MISHFIRHVQAKLTATFRCGQFCPAQLALTANKRRMSDFAASATGWRDLYGATAHRSHSAGFLRGMAMSACPVPAKIRNAAGGFAGEHN
jgi:hypothetical protein